MEAVILVGIQAVGKSSFYQERFFHTHVRINLDMLRTRRRERLLIRACLEAGQPFVVDNTNVKREERAKYIEAARAAGFRVVGYYFPSGVRDALRRNNLRTGARHIPIKGVLGTYKRLQEPSFDEGFDLLYRVRIDASNRFIVTEWPDALPSSRMD
jgi:predicted kinase